MNKSDLVDYLYSEMDEKRSEKFESLVEKDENLKRELEELKQLREILGSHKDLQPYGTPVIFQRGGASNKGFYRKLIGVAAAVLIILLAGYFTNTRLTIGKGSVLMTFGNNPAVQPALQELVTNELSAQEELLTNEMKTIKDELLNSIKNAQKSTETSSTVGIREFASMGDRIKKENQLWTANLLEDVTEQQDEKMEALLNQLLLYIDQRRTEDMEFVRNGFNQVVRSIYEQNPYQQLALSTNSQ